MNMSEYQIECISLSKQYTRNKQIVNAVDDINLCISQNEMVIIKGRSGAGKSTLLSLMSGLIKPTNGKVMIDNNCISELSNDALSKLLLNRIGIIFQSFNLLPTYTIYENIEISIVPKGLKQMLVKETIMSFLEQFKLIDKAHLVPSELSVGQQQKVAVIRTLIKQPSIIFADEPTRSVDDETAGEILEHLMNLKREKQVTLVIATHGNIPEKFADKVVTIENGRLMN
ncbi:MAG: ABC transporter ATP-binding protein [Bacteroidales bacterium]